MVDIPKKNPSEDQQAAALKDVIKAVLQRIKHVVSKGAIMPWKVGDKFKAIERTDDIPDNMQVLRKYLKHEDEKAGRPFKKAFKNGRNA